MQPSDDSGQCLFNERLVFCCPSCSESEVREGGEAELARGIESSWVQKCKDMKARLRGLRLCYFRRKAPRFTVSCSANDIRNVYYIPMIFQRSCRRRVPPPTVYSLE